jgi:hypothetical protein
VGLGILKMPLKIIHGRACVGRQQHNQPAKPIQVFLPQFQPTALIG